MVTIRRVKIRGKYYSQAVVKGKVQAQERWSRKRPFKYLQQIYTQNKTFNPDVKRKITKLTNFNEVVEITRLKKSPKLKDIDSLPVIKPNQSKLNKQKRRNDRIRIQYSVTLTLKDKSVISARSSYLGTPLAPTRQDARDQAWENVIGRLGGMQNNNSDVIAGREVFDKKVLSYQEGWVYYDKIGK